MTATAPARPRPVRPGRDAPAATLLLSDVDDTLLDQTTPLPDVAAGLAAVAPHLEVVLASSRTVEELIYLLHELGLDADLIAENGACTAVRSPAVARCLGASETLTRRGRRWYVASPGIPVAEVRATVEAARAAHGAELRLAPELSARRRAELLGGAYPARLALSRRSSVLIEPPGPGDANDAAIEALRRAGYKAVMGVRWLAVWCGPDKGDAARSYLAARRSAGLRPTDVAAIGDAANDAPLLRAASTRFLVRRYDGRYDPALLAVPAAVPLEAAGHAAWREAAAHLMSRTTPALPLTAQ